jgi:two-component system cell cycle response regulator DivK
MTPRRAATDTILVVDDFEDAREMLAEYLRFRGYHVVEARTGAEAVTLARELKPRVVLMDLTMPELDGWNATRILKTDPATQDIVVIAVTAHALAPDEARARSAGCDGYIPKPYDLKQLAGVVSRALRSANRRRRAEA